MRSCSRAKRTARRLRRRPDDAELVLNEIDYDQVGADSGGFVEIFNAGSGAADLTGIALVLVDGGTSDEYLRRTLTGSLAAGAYLVVEVDAQNGAPDGVALLGPSGGLLDALSYEGAIEAATIGRHDLRPRRRDGLAGGRPRTRTPSRARSRGSRTAATRTTPPPTGRSPRRSPRERRTSAEPPSAVCEGRRSRQRRPFARMFARPIAPAFAQRFRSSAWRRLSSRRSRCASSRCSFL